MHVYAGPVRIDELFVDCRLDERGELPASAVEFAERLGAAHAAAGTVTYVYDGDTGEAHMRLDPAGWTVCYSSAGARMAIDAAGGLDVALTFVGEALAVPPPLLVEALAVLLGDADPI